MESPLAIGMCVRMRGGQANDPRMIITGINGNQIECRWFSSGIPQITTLPVASIYESPLWTMIINGKRNIFECKPDGSYELAWREYETPLVLVAGAPNNGWPADGSYFRLPPDDPLADIGLMRSIFSKQRDGG